jgi:hypothetical protein
MCWHCDPIHINTSTIEPLATVVPPVWNERWKITQLTGEENCAFKSSIFNIPFGVTAHQMECAMYVRDIGR